MANEKRLIDANALLKALEWECGDVCEQNEYSDYLEFECGFSKEAIDELVQNLPTVDAVEVVRCKDCKHYKTITCSCGCNCVHNNWYCADGERKENE